MKPRRAIPGRAPHAAWVGLALLCVPAGGCQGFWHDLQLHPEPGHAAADGPAAADRELAASPCGPAHPDGVCPSPGASCEMGRCQPVSCAALAQEAGDAACAPWRCDPSSGRCVPRRCAPPTAEGICSPGQQCCSRQPGHPHFLDDCPATGTCVPAACGPAAPGGACSADQICVGGRCRPAACSPAAPRGACPANHLCDPAAGACRLLACRDSAGGGHCPAGEACVDDGAGPTCRPVACGNHFPAGPCADQALSGATCLDVGAAGVADWRCVVPPCSPAHPAGRCDDPARLCSQGRCEVPVCSALHPAGVCPRSQACREGTCRPVACALAHPDDGGACPAGEACCTRALAASGFCDAVATCRPAVCSRTFPHGTCPSPDLLCTAGADGGRRCAPVCGPRAPRGACPPGFACVERACMVPCPFDQDCDTIADWDEGLEAGVDTDGDGVPDAFDRDSDGDTIPDWVEAGRPSLSQPPRTTTPGGPPDFRNLDSDGDLISDRLEAGPDPTHPRDTDGDGVPDYLDVDSDGDGILDRCEARDVPGRLCGNRALIDDPRLLADSDGDGVPDVLSLDSDGDGIPDTIEARHDPADPATLDPRGVAHGPDGVPDYRSLDSDGDGALDQDEDVNGNGIVDCQVDGHGNLVLDPRASPACGAPLPGWGPASLPLAYDFNPGCPGHKCLLAETSRIHPDSDGNGIPDGDDGIHKICARGALSQINIHYGRVSDLVLATDPAFDRLGRVTLDGVEVGLAVAASDPASGAFPVSGAALRRPLPVVADGHLDAGVQALRDLESIRQAVAATGVRTILDRANPSFDGFASTHLRVEVGLAEPTTPAALARAIVAALLPGAKGAPGDPAGAPARRRFVLQTKTLVRQLPADPGALASLPAEGALITLLAVVPASDDPDDPLAWDYQSRCRQQRGAGACSARRGCQWRPATGATGATGATAGVCASRPDYQAPMFYADNFSQGSGLTQYGDDIAGMCQSLVEAPSRVDFLWTIDNSGSMADKIGQVMRAAALFFPFLDNSEADYRVGMTTAAANSPYWQPPFPGCFGLDQQACDNSVETYGGYHAQGGCTWHDGACQPACGGLDAAACGHHAGCGWDAAAAACRWRGCAAIASASRCQVAGCAWRAGVGCVGVGTADLINGAIAADFTGAVAGRHQTAADRSVAYRCAEGCAISDNSTASCGGRGDAAACRAHGACMWDAGAGACRVACCPACLDDPDGAPDDPACYFASRLPDDTGAGDEYGLLMTQWALYRAGVRPRCEAAGEAGRCAALPGCAWQDGRCRADVCHAAAAAAPAEAAARACAGATQWPPPRPGAQNEAAALGVAAAALAPAGCGWDDALGRCVASMPGHPAAAGPLPPSPCEHAGGAAACGRLGPGCQWSGAACQPVAAGQEVMCWATDAATCRRQGGGTCEWDTCHGHPDAGACEAVAGCRWRGAGAAGGECLPAADGGTCRPPLARMMRANATHVAVVVSDEEECAVKDGPNVFWGPGITSNPACPDNHGAYDGSCCGDQYQGGLMTYDDPVRLARTRAYADFIAARDVSCFALVGDAADPGRPPAISVVGENGGCHNPGRQLTAEAGQAYIDVAHQTGGGWSSICADQLYPAIESIVLAGLFKASPYRLEGFIGGRGVQPIAATLQVAVERCRVPGEHPGCASGTEVAVVPRSREDGFDYDARHNSLALFGSARPAAGGSVTVSYRYWVDRQQPPAGSQALCPCPETVAPACLCAPGAACGWAAAAGGAPVDVCARLPDGAACGRAPGCRWSAANGGACQATGICAPDPTCGGGCREAGRICDPASGLCVCDPSCGGACRAGERCDNNANVYPCQGRSPATCHGGCSWDTTTASCLSPTCGTCVCDTGCGAGCPKGQICQSDPARDDCGLCQCDLSCGDACVWPQRCNTELGSPLCGMCMAPSCDNCPPGHRCDPAANICLCDTTCGGGTPPAGAHCDGDPASPTCGQLVCDPSCGGGCPEGLLCDADPGSPRCGLCRPDPTCGEARLPCTAVCPAAADPAACAAVPGCRHGRDGRGAPACLAKVSRVCDRARGECVVDPFCLAGDCAPGERCDAALGACVCDVACGGRPCPDGRRCQSDPARPDCGHCLCDVSCGGACPPGQACDGDPASPSCGRCQVDPSCGGCSPPSVCEPTTGLCGPDPLCGGSCPVGTFCRSASGRCRAPGEDD